MDRVPLQTDVWQQPEPSGATKGIGPMSTVAFEDERPPTPDTHISAGSSVRVPQQLLHDVADLRRLLLQDIFVGQSNTKTVEDMWARFREAHRSGMESMLKCQQQEAEMTRLRSEIASCHAALQNATLTRSSLERRVTEREGEVATLKHRLQACEDANRDLLVCAARLSESIFDLAGATDVDSEADRVRVRYDQMETRNAHLQRLMARTSEEKSTLERQVYQWAESRQRLRTQSESVIADKDRAIEMLQAVVAKTEVHTPGGWH